MHDYRMSTHPNSDNARPLTSWAMKELLHVLFNVLMNLLPYPEQQNTLQPIQEKWNHEEYILQPKWNQTTLLNNTQQENL